MKAHYQRAVKRTYGGEELLDLAPRRFLVGECERDLDLERERLRDDLDLLLDLNRGRMKTFVMMIKKQKDFTVRKLLKHSGRDAGYNL